MVKLEVGKSYTSREGECVTIINEDDCEHYPFNGDNGASYVPGGGYFGESNRDRRDLISEVTPEPMAVFPEAAKRLNDASPDEWTMLNSEIPEAALDIQVGGDHYKSQAIQPLEFCMANNYNQCQASIVKYVDRHKRKNGKEDLLKARHYVDLLIQFEYPEVPSGP